MACLLKIEHHLCLFLSSLGMCCVSCLVSVGFASWRLFGVDRCRAFSLHSPNSAPSYRCPEARGSGSPGFQRSPVAVWCDPSVGWKYLQSNFPWCAHLNWASLEYSLDSVATSVVLLSCLLSSVQSVDCIVCVCRRRTYWLCQRAGCCGSPGSIDSSSDCSIRISWARERCWSCGHGGQGLWAVGLRTGGPGVGIGPLFWNELMSRRQLYLRLVASARSGRLRHKCWTTSFASCRCWLAC